MKRNSRIKILLLVCVLLLLIPFIAMQFTDEVQWDGADFAVFGVMLFGLALVIEILLRVVKGPLKRILVLVAILIFLLVWAELAVGIFGTPLAGD